MILRIVEYPKKYGGVQIITEVKITRLFTSNLNGRMTICYRTETGTVKERFCDEIKEWDVIKE